jgi:tRNA wybutosine-synthesizing protein 1
MTVFRGPPGRPSALVSWWRRRPPLGFAAKVSIAIALGLSFVITWTTLSPTSSSQQISTERTYFAADIADPPPTSRNATSTSGGHRKKPSPRGHKKRHAPARSHRPNATPSPDAAAAKANRTEPDSMPEQEYNEKEREPASEWETEPGEEHEQEQEQEPEFAVPEENVESNGKAPKEEEDGKAPELELGDDSTELDGDEDDFAETTKSKDSKKKKKKLPPLFSPAAHYHWKLCSAKSGHHYTPCVDFDGDGSQRHHERSCPRSPVTCLVSLPKEYKLPAPWPERKEKVRN